MPIGSNAGSAGLSCAVAASDLVTGASSPLTLEPAGNVVLFSAVTGAFGREPWVSDGTEAGTQLLFDLYPGFDPSGTVNSSNALTMGTLRDVVKLTTYLTDIRHRADLVPIREEFLGKKSPASTLVAVAALAMPEWLIEIEAVAVI